MIVTSPSAAALNVSHFPAISSLSAGMQSLPAVQFELSPPGAPCSRIVFDYSASLVCNFSDGTSRSGVNFFPGGISSHNLGQTELRGTIRASCRFSVEGWTFGTVASCQIRVIIPVLAISALTPSFSVEAGPAVSGYLIGFLPSQVSGASILWSSNSSGVPCVEVQLLDAFNNPATKSQVPFLLSAFLFETVIPYELFGETTARTDGMGIVRWCNIRVSAVSSQPVCLRASGSSLSWILPTCTNVSRSGVATALSWENSSAVINSTTPVISGTGLSAIRFLVSDAAGNIASDSAQRIVIRLRVVRTVFNGSSSLYVFCDFV